MRIIVLHRFFPPDANPYGAILEHIVSWWREAGHHVEVIAGASTDRPSVRREPSVTRLTVLSEQTAAGRLINFILFPLRAFWQILWTRQAPDVVMCGTMPQVTMGFFVSLAARIRGASFVYHCMDLHPEAGAISGEFSNRVTFSLLRWMDLQTMRRAARVVVLSPDMKRSALARDPRLADKVDVLNNFALEDAAGAAGQHEVQSRADTMRVVFTGNIGRFQGLEALIRAYASLPEDSKIELVFMGNGRAREGLQELVGRIGADGVTFLQQGSAADAAALMRTSHLGVVSLVPKVIRYAFPSKTANYLAAGLPLLIVCERDSALVQEAVNGRYGFAAEPGDVDGIRDALIAAYQAFKTPAWNGVVQGACDAGAREGKASYRQRWIDFVSRTGQSRF